VVTASLLLVIGIILTACSSSEADRSAQVTAIAAGIYATQTAAVPGPAPTPAPLAGPPVTATAVPAPPTAAEMPAPPTATPAPSTATPIPPTAQPAAELNASPVSISAEVRASAEQVFASDHMVYLYDPQPGSISRSNLDATEFSLRYILSKDARGAPNFLFLRKTNAKGSIEYIIPAKKRMVGDETVSLADWSSETGTLTFTPSSNSMIDTSDKQGGDPNTAVLTAWIVGLPGIAPLYGPPNPHVEDPAYLDVLLLAPEVRDAAQSSPDASQVPYDKVMVLSTNSRSLSNTVRIPIAP
jgi:hypothetical protein